MSIINYADLFIGALISMILCAYVTKKIFNLNYNKNKKIIFVVFIFSAAILAIVNTINKDTFKILLTFPFVVIAIKHIFSINYNKSIIFVIFSLVYLFVGEIMTAIICSILPFDYSFIFNNILGTVFGNMTVAIFTMPIASIKPLNNVINKIVNNINEKSKLIITILLVTSIGALGYKNAIGTEDIIIIFMNIIVTVTLLIIIYMYYTENMKSKELSKDYNIMLNYLESYEKELVEKRKIIHDYKNELIVINGYIDNNNKLKEYLNELIKEQKLIKENSLIKNIDKLPRGLKGLIYYKLSQNENIKADLNVLTKLDKFDTLPPKINKDVLKIIGILIDNAIEAIYEESDKYINIEFSIKKEIFKIKIINTCTKAEKTTNIMNSGFSTKGKNRGYGLALVKDILAKEEKIDLKIKFENKLFISELQVKI